MAYRVVIVKPAEREQLIRASLREPHCEQQDFYDFRNRKTRLNVVPLDLQLPIYRMENLRAFIHQRDYILAAQKPEDYFRLNEEDEGVQQIQHEILVNLAHKGRDASVVPIIEVLGKEKQREPILITYKGLVVNGNRRLAAMRELYHADGAAYAEFRNVSCMVLPEDAGPEDILEIEAGLQAKVETKLSYDWIADAKLISNLMSGGRPRTDIAERLNRTDAEIERRLQALAEADIYLNEWARAEGDYIRVAEEEQLFHDLPELLIGKDRHLKAASRAIAWTLHDNKFRLEDPLSSFNLAFGKRAMDVLERLESDLNLKHGGRFIGRSYEAIIDCLRDPNRQEETVEALIEACYWAIEAERSQKSRKAALKAVRAANAKLTEVDLSTAAPGTFAALDNQLDALITKATELKANVARYRGFGVSQLDPQNTFEAFFKTGRRLARERLSRWRHGR